jgi:hypothetical protein
MYIVPCGGEPPPLNTQPFGFDVVHPAVVVRAERADGDA